MKIFTTYSTIFLKTGVPEVNKFLAFSLMYQDFMVFMDGKNLEPNEDNFKIFCSQQNQKYDDYLAMAETYFSKIAREYAMEMNIISPSIENILKETENRLNKIDKNTKKKYFSNFGWGIVSSMLGTVVLFCIMAGLSFALLPTEREGMKPLQYIGRTIDKVLWQDELNN